MNTIHLRKHDRDVIAAALSVIPGVGHLYKHHFVGGLGILVGANIFMLFVAFWLSFATFGLSLILVPIGYYIFIAYSAYELEDWHHHHHYLHPWTKE